MYIGVFMRLIKISVQGFRRLAEESTMDVGGKIVAIVGPNEAGKSSFLKAITHLDLTDPFDPTDFTRDGGGDAWVRAQFKLDAKDRDALESIPGGPIVQDYSITRQSDGTRFSEVTPEPSRDLAPRAKLHSVFYKFRESKWLENLESDLADSDEGTETTSPRTRIDRVIEILASTEQNLSEESIALLRDELEELRAIEDQKALSNALNELDNLADAESMANPLDRVKSVLWARRPEYLFFDNESRHIPDSQSLNDVFPRGLQNLCDVAELDVGELQSAVAEDDNARRKELLDRANHVLKEVFDQSWRQSDVSVLIEVSQNQPDIPVIEVFAFHEDWKYANLSQRSDGLRQFIALVAFIETQAARSNAPKILLIDEAEQHLHYDAQADLVRVLTTQPEAEKVIFTTHSAGCLPSDLGTGVRLIKPDGPMEIPEGKWDHSKIVNWFWTESGTGFSPLLIGMGASNFAFSATRYALMTEGPSDMILLPTLFAEAGTRDHLLFQCVPGLSETTTKTAKEFTSTAGSVCYLVDGDGGGDAIRKDLLEEALVAEDHIFSLKPEGEVLETEDLVDRDTFDAALRETVSDFWGVEIPEDLVPEVGRVDVIDAWLSDNIEGSPKTPKREIAQRILSMRNDRPVLSSARKAFVATLLSEIEAALGIPDPAE